jgi:hypothetical protein
MYCATGLSLALHGADRQTRGGRQRYSVYSLYWYKSLGGRQRYSVYSFYWYKSTITDAEEAERFHKLLALLARYSLYWYKSTNTDEEEAEEVRKELGLMHSDHLTTLRAFDGWQASAANRALIEP